MSLLQTIENSAIDSKVPIADLLRQCKVLAARLKNEELAAWATRELEGYDERKDVPDYRVLCVPHSVGHFLGPFGMQMKNQPIPLRALPDEIRVMLEEMPFKEPISILEQISNGKEEMLESPWPADIVAYVADHHPIFVDVRMMAAWRSFPKAMIRGIVDTVRTRILDFVLKIQAENPDAGEAPLNAAKPPIPPGRVMQHFHTTIVGGMATIGNLGPASIGDGNVATGTMGTPAKARADVKKLVTRLKAEAKKVPADRREEATEIVGKMAKHTKQANWDPLKLKRYVELYATLVTVASPTVHQIGELLAPLLHNVGGSG